jgi:hypothetical protein
MSTNYFAWVNSTDTTFSQTFARNDENVVSCRIRGEENHFPEATIVIKNPRIGLMNPSRKLWCWVSRTPDDALEATPLFFGVLDSIPDNIFAETVTLKFLAKSPDVIALRQATAETLKVAPQYNPIFLSDAKRDDPDAILEGWSALYHYDRTTLAVTASDILVGEDGTLIFGNFAGAKSLFYDNLSYHRGEIPLNNVQVKMDVHWTQRTFGFVPGPQVNVTTYTGDTFLSQWPHPGTNLGGGWTVENSLVNDVYLVSLTPNYSVQTSLTFEGPAVDCSTKSATSSFSGPALLDGSISGTITSSIQDGMCDATGTLSLSLTSFVPVNIPLIVHTTGVVVPQWYLNCFWKLRYDASRVFTETITFNITADTQILSGDPTVEQQTEVIELPGADVGQPIIVVDAWTDLAGQAVSIGQIIFPNNPLTPGGLSYQVCVVAGTAGLTEPVFSDTVGMITVDNTVQWASLGSSPLLTQPDWQNSTFVPLGEIICYQPVVFDTVSGILEKTGASYYLICTGEGETNSEYTTVTYTPLPTSNVEGLPEPLEFSYIIGPSTSTFVESGNGTAVWTYLGAAPAFLGIPLGGTPTDQKARCFFPTDAGNNAIQHGMCRARARLRLRARAVTIGWDCLVDDILGISCRMNASVYEPRLPGGTATGKVTSYDLIFSEEEGLEIGHVEIGVSVGNAGTITVVPGTSDYVASGYVAAGYFQETRGTVLVGDIDDLGYTPPTFVPFDDGLNFPLMTLPGTSLKNQIVNSEYPPTGDSQTISGSLANQGAAIGEGIQTMARLASIDLKDAALGVAGAWNEVYNEIAARGSTLQYLMTANPIVYEVDINPVTNGPFNGAYSVTCTALELPQGINLSASSS